MKLLLPAPKCQSARTILLLVGTALSIASCSKDEDKRPERVFGPTVQMGDGTARSWIFLDAAGNPKSIGFTLTEKALDNLPTTAAMSDFMLALPDEATKATPFQHLMINWNAEGHEPMPIYGVPHFDFHFYLVPMNEVMSIPPYPQAAAKYDLAMSEFVKR